MIYLLHIIILLIILFFCIYTLINKPTKKYSYLFLQQNEDSCHISSWYNYNLLQKMRKKSNIINKEFINKCTFYDKYYWYAYDSKITLYWHNFMSLFSITNPIYSNNKNIREFIDVLLSNAVIFPHIYIDKNCNISYFKKKGLYSLGLFYFLPNTCIDYNSIKNIDLNLYIHSLKLEDIFDLPDRDISFPCYNKKNKIYIYNSKYKKFINFTGKIEDISNYYDVPANNVKYMGFIDNKTHSIQYKIKIDTKSFINLLIPTLNNTDEKIYAQQYVNTNGIGISNKLNESVIYIIYGASNLYWNLFLCGINNNNQIIKKGDYLYKHYLTFKQVQINNDPKSYNIWGNNNKYLDKTTIFQYQLTKLLNSSDDLYNKILYIFSNFPVDILSIYDELGDYYNKEGIRYKKTMYKNFILGKKQMVSYLLSIIIWLLWNRCISIQNFAKSLQTNTVFGHVLWIIFYHFITKKYNNYSILDAIFSINDIFSKNEKEYVSICSHSYVISYKKDLIELQINANKNKEYTEIFKRLPAIIDSWNGKYFKNNVFYIK